MIKIIKLKGMQSHEELVRELEEIEGSRLVSFGCFILDSNRTPIKIASKHFIDEVDSFDTIYQSVNFYRPSSSEDYISYFRFNGINIYCEYLEIWVLDKGE